MSSSRTLKLILLMPGWLFAICIASLISVQATAQLHQPMSPAGSSESAEANNRIQPMQEEPSVPRAPVIMPYPRDEPANPEERFSSDVPRMPPSQSDYSYSGSPAQQYQAPSYHQPFSQSQSSSNWIHEPVDPSCCSEEYWEWTLLPEEVMYKSYVAGPCEPRLAQGLVYMTGHGWYWDLEAGGRVGILRYGTQRKRFNEGWQLDVWGAALPRLSFNDNLDVDAVDFKVGVPLTWTRGKFQAKLEWYHISSHLGDEFLLRNPGFQRIDYLRDAIVFGGGYFPIPDLRVYAEADYAYNTNGGAKPWHFQFGFDYSPVRINTIRKPSPFLAVNSLIRQEVGFSGGVNVVAGLQWRGCEKHGIFRTGFQYYNGESLQMSFLNEHEELIGFGMWYDF